MATKLVLRNTTKAANAATLDLPDGIVYDILAAQFGSATDTLVTNTAASGTNIQCTKTAGGATVAWISGRVPAGGFTLTTADISVWGVESNMNANAAGRVHVYKWSPGSPATVTELGASPFSDNAEVGTSTTELTWICNVTDTAFAENDRILIRLYLTNAPSLTMGGGFTVTFTFNGADAATGDSFFNINETVSFKVETVTVALNQVTETDTANSITRLTQTNVPVNLVTETDAAQPIAKIKNRSVNQNSETDLAQPIAHVKSRTIAQITESDTAQPITRVKVVAPGQATEADQSQAISKIKQSLIAQVVESDSAQPISTPSGTPVGQAVETDLAQSLFARKVVVVAQAVEIELAQGISSDKLKAIAQVIESDSALSISTTSGTLVEQVEETDLAQSFSRIKKVLLLQVTETDLAQVFSPAGGVMVVLGIATLSDYLVDVASLSDRRVDVASVSDILYEDAEVELEP